MVIKLGEITWWPIRNLKQILRVRSASNKSPLLNCIDVNFLYPKKCLTRIGTTYGGWLLPKDHQLTSSSVCYLAGAGEDISFDCSLVEQFGVQARILDPTPKAISHFEGLTAAVNSGERFAINKSPTEFYSISQEQFSSIRFLPFGLAGDDIEMKFYFPRDPNHVSCSTLNLQQTDTWFCAQCFRLSTLMRVQGDATIDLLKMDIEGGEYVVIDDLISSMLLPRVLLIEVDEAHTPLDDGAMGRINDRIRRLEDAGMHCIAVDGCNATFRYEG
jgi:FkbM family methyltransferase